MSYEYLIKAQDNILLLEKLHQSLMSESGVVVCDSGDNGFSVFFAENRNNKTTKKWGGDFYLLKTSGELLLVINSDHNRAMKLINNAIRRESFAVDIEKL